MIMSAWTLGLSPERGCGQKYINWKACFLNAQDSRLKSQELGVREALLLAQYVVIRFSVLLESSLKLAFFRDLQAKPLLNAFKDGMSQLGKRHRAEGENIIHS